MINWEQLKEDTLKIQIEDTYPVKWKRKHSTMSSLSSDFHQTGLPSCSDGLWQIQLPCIGWGKAVQKSNQWNKDFLVTVIIQTNQGITLPYRPVKDLTQGNQTSAFPMWFQQQTRFQVSKLKISSYWRRVPTFEYLYLQFLVKENSLSTASWPLTGKHLQSLCDNTIFTKARVSVRNCYQQTPWKYRYYSWSIKKEPSRTLKK